MRASADRSADECAYVLFGSEDKVRIGPKKRRRLDQLQSFQTGVTLLADNDVALDRNTELLRDLNNHSRHLDVSTRWCWVSSRMIVHQHDRTANDVRLGSWAEARGGPDPSRFAQESGLPTNCPELPALGPVERLLLAQN